MQNNKLTHHLSSESHKQRFHTPLSSFNRWQRPCSLAAVAILSLTTISCSQDTSSTTEKAAGAPGTLLIKANGEDFVRNGFVDKDGWQIDFEHVYVTLANITAAQEKAQDQAIQADGPFTIDLKGTATEPVLVTTLENVPSGRYNALAWQVVETESGPAEGHSLVMIGTATKANEEIPFTIQLQESFLFSCGDFVGDVRKGILESGETAELEATFHFDHIFGDAEAPADDEINQGALGFKPLAALASEGAVVIDSDGLENQLSAEDYETLQNVLPSLGHVGEGHCEATDLTASAAN
ncbi:MAG: DUF4382 domain-containing protein [Cyanobacteria bacterium J06649_4]